jgi:glycosyltransferase involved in cell wall biosynthesis
MALIETIRQRPFVYYFHGPASLEARLEGRSEICCRTVDVVERAFYRRASVVTCLSEAFAQIVVDHYGVDSRRVVVIPGGLGELWFGMIPERLAVRESLGWSDSKAHILAVRRLVRRVGIDSLLQALALPERLNSIMLHIVGEGPLRAELEEKTLTLGLHEQVRFHGMVSDKLLQGFYAAANFTVVPSLDLEGFGMAAIESLALGTPVLATPVGGLPEILRPFDPRCVTRDTSPEALREGIEGMLEFALTPTYRSRCREFAQHRHSWSGLAVRHEEDIYRHVANLQPTRC